MALTSIHLHELAFIFGILGNIVSFGVFLAPMPTFWRIYKNKSTQGFQSIPYAVSLFSATLLLYYALVKESNGTMIIIINTIGVAIQGFYLTIYMIYAPRKARVYTSKLLSLFNLAFYGLIMLTTLVFIRGNDHHTLFSRGGDREKAVGWICAVFSVCVFAAPLSVMRMVIRTKSVEFMPFWLSFSLTLCAVMWFFYGFLIHDFYIALPNVLGLAFGIAQMILYIVYKDSKKCKLAIKRVGVDMKQLQAELAVDIRLGNIEKIDEQQQPQDSEVIEVVVEQMRVVNQANVDNNVDDNNNNKNNNENGIGNDNVGQVIDDQGNAKKSVKLPLDGEKEAAGELPRGELIV